MDLAYTETIIITRIDGRGVDALQNQERRKHRVLFICVNNSARSQMAEGLVNHYYSNRWTARSAGTIPTSVHPMAIKAMSELGIDISSHRSKSIEEFKGDHFDLVVTVCNNASETCPFFPADKIVHKNFQDPARATGSEEEKLEAFRRTRDSIKDWLAATLGSFE